MSKKGKKKNTKKKQKIKKGKQQFLKRCENKYGLKYLERVLSINVILTGVQTK